MTNFTYIADYELRRGTPYSAGLDLKCVMAHTCGDNLINLHLGCKVMFETEEDRREHCFLLCPRSSFTKKYGLYMVNAPGIIDSDYQGELIMQVAMVPQHTHHDPNLYRKAQACVDEYVAQIIPVKTATVLTFPEKVESFEIVTERGEGGYGSTDVIGDIRE